MRTCVGQPDDRSYRPGLAFCTAAAAVLLIVAPFFAPGMASSPQAAEPAGSDRRQPLRLARAERDAIRAEMRQMLASVGGVVRGVSGGDREAIATAARASGMATAVDPHLEKKLPRRFVEMGERTHQGFDGLADAAKGGTTTDALMTRLADVIKECNACHATYRLAEGR